jgi:hypothetical protein
MLPSLRRVLLLLVVTVVPAACMGELDGSLPDRDPAPDPQSKVSLNNLRSYDLAQNRGALIALAQGPLGTLVGQPDGQPAPPGQDVEIALDPAAVETLASSEGGRSVLHYVAVCALESSQTLVAEVDGVTHRFKGLIGLAPAWAEAALQPSDKRWLTACLAAHFNALDMSIRISLRGDHPALTVLPDEAQSFVLQEGAFYGDYFQDGIEPVPDAYSCLGEMYLEDAVPEADFPLRICATGSCSLKSVGTCRPIVQFGPGGPPGACEDEVAGHYSRCHARLPLGDGTAHGDETYVETITTYLLAGGESP